MIVDTRTNELPALHGYDVCIIGAGAAGITLALELAERSKQRIALVETGGFTFDTEVQSRFRGIIQGTNHPPLDRVRYAGVGGSTQLWAGWCKPLDPMDFEQRPWIRDSGWPIRREELDSFYQQANRWCSLGTRGYSVAEWNDQFSNASLAEHTDLNDTLFQVKRIRFGDEYRQRLNHCSQIDLLHHATAVRLVAARDNQRHIQQLQLRLGNGQTVPLDSSRFVLAAGGLENPRLLLLSGDSPGTAIGNQNALVGRYYSEHGFINSGWFQSPTSMALDRYFPVDNPDGSAYGSARQALTLQKECFEREQLCNAVLYFHPSYESHELFNRDSVRAALEFWEVIKGQAVRRGSGHLLAKALAEPHRLAHAALRKTFTTSRVATRWRTRCYFECSPTAENRVELSEQCDNLGRPIVKVTWDFARRDIESVWRFHELIDERLRRSHTGALQCPDTLDEWIRRAETGKHTMGTTRMHNDPKHGVVDSNCRVHGTDNLYIAGSSVFPAYGYANPTLTIVALAVRLATHLSNPERHV